MANFAGNSQLFYHLGVHAGNGLRGARDEAGERLKSCLRDNGAMENNRINWKDLLDMLF